MPLSGLASDVAAIGPQLWPPSVDQQAATTRCRVRQRTCIRPSGQVRMHGWIAPNSRQEFKGPIFCQVCPRSGVRSRWARQPRCSVLDGQRMTPPGSATGLFLIGPRMPRGSLRGADQVSPAVGGAADHAPPAARTRADLVEQQQRPSPGLMEHRIPARLRAAGAIQALRHPDGQRPPPVEVTCQPDPDLRVPLVRPAEPGRDQAGRGFGDGRGVRRRERRLLEDELRSQAEGLASSTERPDR